MTTNPIMDLIREIPMIGKALNYALDSLIRVDVSDRKQQQFLFWKVEFPPREDWQCAVGLVSKMDFPQRPWKDRGNMPSQVIRMDDNAKSAADAILEHREINYVLRLPDPQSLTGARKSIRFPRRIAVSLLHPTEMKPHIAQHRM